MIEKVRQRRHDGKPGECRAPGTQSGRFCPVERFLGLLHGGVDRQRRERPVMRIARSSMGESRSTRGNIHGRYRLKGGTLDGDHAHASGFRKVGGLEGGGPSSMGLVGFVADITAKAGVECGTSGRARETDPIRYNHETP